VLGSLGVASRRRCCGRVADTSQLPRAPVEDSGEVRSWLHDAVAKLRGAFPIAHGLAVSRRRTTGAIDVLGESIARGRWDGVVLTVGEASGARREQVTSNLSREGVERASLHYSHVRRSPRPSSSASR